MIHFIACSETVTEVQAAQYYMNNVAKIHGVLKYVYSNWERYSLRNSGVSYADCVGQCLGVIHQFILKRKVHRRG